MSNTSFQWLPVGFIYRPANNICLVCYGKRVTGAMVFTETAPELTHRSSPSELIGFEFWKCVNPCKYTTTRQSRVS